jgi:hypothetical protein
MKPWESPEPDEDILEEWESTHTRDYYYATLTSLRGKTLVFVVPIDVFNETAYMYANSIPIRHIIPGHLTEIAASVYETRITERVVSLDMLQRGFIHDEKFQAFVNRQYREE